MKFIKSVTLTGVSLLLVGTSAMSVIAEDDASRKEEVVYVMSDAKGGVKDIEVVNIFNGGSITDYGDYTRVKILNTNDKISQNGDTVTFSSNAEKVYYQGTLDNKEIPWDISIRYFLDGKEYSANDIAGKSGALEIYFSVKKSGSDENDFYENYALQASFTLDTEHCRDIVADGATVANVGNDKQLNYTILPGKGIDTVIKANVTDFEMNSVSINGVKLNLDVDFNEEELTDKVNTLVSAIGKIDSGATELNEGTEKLSDATGTLYDKTGELNQGVARLTNGVNSLYSGLAEITTQNDQLTSGAYTAYQGLCSAASNALNYQLKQNGIDEVTLTPDNYSDVLMNLLEQMNADGVYQQAYQVALQKVSQQVEAQADTLYDSYIRSQENSIYQEYINSQADTLYQQVAMQAIYEQLMQSGYSEEQINIYLQSENGQVLISQTVANMTDEQKEQILASALSQLTDEQKEQILQGASASLSEEEKSQIREAYIQQMMSSDEVTSQLNEAVLTVSEEAKEVSNLKRQLDNYGVFYKGLLNYTGAVGDATQGAKSLKLNMDVLKENTDTLHVSVGNLNEAVKKLSEGTKELSNGTYEFADKTSDMNTQITDEMDTLTSLTGNEENNISFVSDKNTNVDSVQFVIKTDAIEKSDTSVTEEKEETSETFIQKLLHLFGMKL